MNKVCPQCGAPVKPNAATCEYCGAALETPAAAPQPAATSYYSAPQQEPVYQAAPDPRAYWPVRNKSIAALLAIFLGSFGIHEFYLGRNSKGIIMLLFCWSYIPGIIGLIQGIGMLTSSNEAFEEKYEVRT